MTGLAVEPCGNARPCPAYATLTRAYHEAGHCVVAPLVRPPCPIDTVTILLREDGAFARTSYAIDGGGLLDCYHAGEKAGLVAALGSNAAACLAGPLAEEAFLAGEPSNADLNDLRRLAEVVPVTLALAGNEFVPDLGTAFIAAIWDRPWRLRWLLSQEDACDAVTGYIANAAKAAKHILDQPRVFHAVGLVAQALMKRRTLSGADVEAIVRPLLPRSA